MLAALAAILLPPLIEWLFRWRRRQVELPTIRFLLNQEQQKKVRRQDRLLLLLRMAAIGLLIFALARPLLRHGWIEGQQKRNVVVLLDATASMQQQVDVTTAFHLAQRKAADMVRQLPKSTTVTLVTLGHRVTEIARAETDLHTVAARIEQVKPTSGAAPMSAALSWIDEFLRQQNDARAEVYVFSDFQKHTWNGSADRALEASQSFRSLAGRHETYLIDVGGSPQFNLLAGMLRPQQYVLSAGLPVTFQAVAESRGTVPPGTQARVTLLVDGVKKDVRRWTPSGSAASFEFSYRFAESGEYLVEIVVDGDTHLVDNRRRFLCHVPQEIGVLVLDEQLVDEFALDETTAARPSSAYFARAIRPPEHPGMEKLSHFAVKSIIPARLSYENLADYPVVVLASASSVNETMAARLQRYVADGGSLWLFLGSSVNLFEYNRYLFNEGRGLLPCPLAEKVSVAADEEGVVYPVFGDSTHPALAEFARAAASPEMALSRYVRLEAPPDDETVRVVVSLSDGSPSIVEKQLGRGRVLLTNTSAGIDGNYLPALPEFPILVQELLRYLVGSPDAGVNLEVGDRFVQPVYVSTQQMLLLDPDGQPHRLTPNPRSHAVDELEIVFDETNKQGVYRVDVIEEVLPRRRFVVNANAQESDLARLTRGDFEDTFGGAAQGWLDGNANVAQFAADLHTVTELSPPLVWALLGMLAVESLCAWRFGRRRSAGS